MLGITNNIQANLTTKKPVTNQQQITFTAEPVIDTFTKSAQKKEISFNGKMLDFILGKNRNSKLLNNYVEQANSGDQDAKNAAVKILCSRRLLTDESQIAALKMLETKGTEQDMQQLLERIVYSEKRPETVQIKALSTIPIMAERLKLDLNVLEELYNALEPLYYLPENLEGPASEAQDQIQLLINDRSPYLRRN